MVLNRISGTVYDFIKNGNIKAKYALITCLDSCPVEMLISVKSLRPEGFLTLSHRKELAKRCFYLRQLTNPKAQQVVERIATSESDE